jgi:hypothetical protein
MTSVGVLIEDATAFTQHCCKGRSVRAALECFLKHCLKEEPLEDEEDIEAVEELLEEPHPDQYPHDEHAGLDIPDGYSS